MTTFFMAFYESYLSTLSPHVFPSLLRHFLLSHTSSHFCEQGAPVLCLLFIKKNQSYLLSYAFLLTLVLVPPKYQSTKITCSVAVFDSIWSDCRVKTKIFIFAKIACENVRKLKLCENFPWQFWRKCSQKWTNVAFSLCLFILMTWHFGRFSQIYVFPEIFGKICAKNWIIFTKTERVSGLLWKFFIKRNVWTILKNFEISQKWKNAFSFSTRLELGAWWGWGILLFPLSTLQGKFCISFLGIARPQSQFPHSCVCEPFIYSQNWSTYFPAAE